MEELIARFAEVFPERADRLQRPISAKSPRLRLVAEDSSALRRCRRLRRRGPLAPSGRRTALPGVRARHDPQYPVRGQRAWAGCARSPIAWPTACSSPIATTSARSSALRLEKYRFIPHPVNEDLAGDRAAAETAPRRAAGPARERLHRVPSAAAALGAAAPPRLGKGERHPHPRLRPIRQGSEPAGRGRVCRVGADDPGLEGPDRVARRGRPRALDPAAAQRGHDPLHPGVRSRWRISSSSGRSAARCPRRSCTGVRRCCTSTKAGITGVSRRCRR